MARKKFNMKKIMTKVGGAAVGGAVGQASNKILGKFDPRISALAKIAVGAVLPEFMPKNEFVGEAGSGLIGVGAAELTKALVPALAGIGDTLENAIGQETDYIIDSEYNVNGIGADPENSIGNVTEEDNGY